MTEKRFFKDRNEVLTWIRDKETWEKLKTDDEIVDKLNALHEKNEQFKEKVFNTINKKLQDNENLNGVELK